MKKLIIYILGLLALLNLIGFIANVLLKVAGSKADNTGFMFVVFLLSSAVCNYLIKNK